MKMKRAVSLIVVLVVLTAFHLNERFEQAQLKYTRVSEAFSEKEELIDNSLRSIGVPADRFQMYVRVFKEEEELEVWVKERGAYTYQLLKVMPICSTVGFSGPKERRGDGQIPEGLYYINSFNPFSNYHLSLKINYPNLADQRRADHNDLGGMIFLHGGCETIGCVPITDDQIKELYVMAVKAKDQGQEIIRVHIFPNRMDQDNYKKLVKGTRNTKFIHFWGNLRTAYYYFETYKYLPGISVDAEGRYVYTHRSPAN